MSSTGIRVNAPENSRTFVVNPVQTLYINIVVVAVSELFKSPSGRIVIPNISAIVPRGPLVFINSV